MLKEYTFDDNFVAVYEKVYCLVQIRVDFFVKSVQLGK